MTPNLQVFYNEASNVNIRMEQIDNEPWFVAKDVALALDITWSGHTLGAIPEEWQGVVNFITPCGGYQGGGKQSLKVINEAALYKLAFRSNKPTADAFVNWVASHVLPSIRRTGSYQVGEGEVSSKPAKLPLPKYRPYYAEWRQRVSPYISRKEIQTTAEYLSLSISHVAKVYRGTTSGERVTELLTAIARFNRENGESYPEYPPIHQQMVIEWDEELSVCASQ